MSTLTDLVPIILPAVGAVAGAVAAPVLLKRALPDHAETFIADRIPFVSVEEDGETVTTINDGLLRVFRLSGYLYTGKDDTTLERLEARRQQFFLALREFPVDLRIVSDRRTFSVPPPPLSHGVLREIDALWHQRFSDSATTEHHIIISVADKAQRGRLDEATQQLRDFFHDYGPAILRNEDVNGASPLLTFLARYISHFPITVPPATHALGERLAFANVHHSPDGSFIYQDGARVLYGAAIGIRAWPEFSTAQIIRKVLTVQGDLSLVVHARPYSKLEATKAIEHRERQAKLAEVNRVIAAEWEEVRTLVGSDKETLYHTEITVFAHAETREALATLINTIRSTLASESVRALQESMLAERLWWARLPGYDYFSREYTLLTSNIAAFVPLPDEPKGLDRCSWGPRNVRYFPTASGSPYGLTFHIHAGDQAPPHFALYGGTGKGKTTFITFAAYGTLSAFPKSRVYIFDRNLGAQVAIVAAGGSYIIPEADTTPLNPLDTPNTKAARAALARLFAVLSGLDDDQAKEVFEASVRDLMELPIEHRRLDLQWESAFPAGTIRDAMKKWVSGDRFGRILNGKRDALDLTGPRIVGFAMDSIREDPQLAAALTYYFMRRIRMAVKIGADDDEDGKGQPHLIIIDEAPAMVSNPIFAAETDVLLREHRKLEGAVGLAFQEVNAMLTSRIANTVRTNVTTSFFWPGSVSSYDEADALKLTEDEAAFAMGRSELAHRLQYGVLLKRENESVILDLNLSAIGPYVRLFAGGDGPSQRMQQFIHEFGVSGWVREFVTR